MNLDKFGSYKTKSGNNVKFNGSVDPVSLLSKNSDKVRDLVTGIIDTSVFRTGYWNVETGECVYGDGLSGFGEKIMREMLKRYDIIMLSESDIEFLKSLKKEGFRIDIINENEQSGYHEFMFILPDGQIFKQDEITRHYCQGCIDDLEELEAEMDEDAFMELEDNMECHCAKEIHRKRIERLLDLLKESEKEVIEFYK